MLLKFGHTPKIFAPPRTPTLPRSCGSSWAWVSVMAGVGWWLARAVREALRWLVVGASAQRAGARRGTGRLLSGRLTGALRAFQEGSGISALAACQVRTGRFRAPSRAWFCDLLNSIGDGSGWAVPWRLMSRPTGGRHPAVCTVATLVHHVMHQGAMGGFMAGSHHPIGSVVRMTQPITLHQLPCWPPSRSRWRADHIERGSPSLLPS